MNPSNEDAESVDAFLERIASLKDKRDREDEERTRKLEDDILQGRRDRQARRAERARSMSPQKNSESAASASSLNLWGDGSSPEVNLSPSPRPPTMGQSTQIDPKKTFIRDDTSRRLPPSPTKSSAHSGLNTAAFSRSGTLTWQQRPSSRDSDIPRSRPLSRHTDEATLTAPDAVDEGHTRDQIALSLSSKDPSWFCQTSDRGVRSTAYIKSTEEGQPDIEQGSRPLPGLSPGSSVEPETAGFSLSSRQRSPSPSQTTSAQHFSGRGDRFSSVSSQAMLGDVSSPLPTNSLEDDQSGSQRSGLSALQGHQSRDRPASPTKGLGGFVQSAMMKRSDSVNKRWSAQAAPGLSRGNSIASYRGGVGHSTSISEDTGSPPRNANMSSRGPASSPTAKSRPTSSHSTSTIIHQTEPRIHSLSTQVLVNSNPEIVSRRSPVKDAPSHEDLSREPSFAPESPDLRSSDALPVSPTKTMDPKRWSPTKASWLESALARPESIKVTSPKPQPPIWMSDLQKSKLSKDDPESFKSTASSFTLVSPTGLMRSPPPGGHSRPLSIGGLPEGFNSGLIRKSSPEKPPEPIVEEDSTAKSTLVDQINPSLASPTMPVSDRSASPEVKIVSSATERREMLIAIPKANGESPPRPTVKPSTPPKADFRANLKSRQKISEENTAEEPEFKNVFGKLKRAQTRNYIAPDELKDNILKGKAALSLSSGPQKGNKVDEFKDSILKRKDSMKAGQIPPRKVMAGSGQIDTALQETSALPEALAKRSALTKRADSSKTSPADIPPKFTPVISYSKAAKAMGERLHSVEDHSHLSGEMAKPQAVAKNFDTDGDIFNTRKLKPLTTAPAFAKDGEKTSITGIGASVHNSADMDDPPPASIVTTKQSKGDGPANNLAGRLNPNLVGIISRSQTPELRSRNLPGEKLSSTSRAEAASRIEEPQESPASILTHMTKARAKGPKRRLPKLDATCAKPEVPLLMSKQTDVFDEMLQKVETLSEDKAAHETDYSLQNQKTTTASQPLADLINNNDKVPTLETVTKKPLPPRSNLEPAQRKEMGRSSDSEAKPKTRPVVAAKSPTLKRISSPPSANNAATANSDQKLSSSGRLRSGNPQADSRTKQVETGGKIEAKARSSDVRQVRDSSSTSSTSGTKSATSLRRDLPKPPLESGISGTPASTGKPILSGLGLKIDSRRAQPPDSQLTPPPEEKSTKTLDLMVSPAQVHRKDSFKVSDQATPQLNGPKITELLNDFFNEKPQISDRAEIDAQAIILSRPSGDSKSKVLKTQVCQINADGKRESLPPQQEHILFEDSMYLCVHSFVTKAGSTASEVYLWAGDRVSEAAIEDAQLFCRKEARDNSTRLEVMRQGKEPPKLFQALGGIVITRRSKTSSMYMLCGRRHLGHVAFDEVDLHATSLCSGFPYLISAKFGKLYLWKGKGSGADEVGCARLIGMDLGLTGEIEEVDEGEEPPSFLESFGGSWEPQISSQHWSLRSKPEQYGCRLFRIELEQSRGMTGFWMRRGSSPAKATKANVQEVQPFCQRDLNSRSIYVLDAYFTIFVYVGAEASSKSAEFVTALMFSQEYGILAASSEDRPSIPTCKITFNAAPLDFTAAFRKWEGPTGVERQSGREGQIIELNDALEALSSGGREA